jgi:hypothetical protein
MEKNELKQFIFKMVSERPIEVPNVRNVCFANTSEQVSCAVNGLIAENKIQTLTIGAVSYYIKRGTAITVE